MCPSKKERLRTVLPQPLCLRSQARTLHRQFPPQRPGLGPAVRAGRSPLRAAHSPTARMRKPRGGRRARRHQASRSTCRLAGGARTSSTPRRSQPWKASREAARASREFQKQRALALRKARNTARPLGSSAPSASSCASSLHSTSAKEPGASCTGRAMLPRRPGPAASVRWCPRSAGGISLLCAAPAAGGTGLQGAGSICAPGRGWGGTCSLGTATALAREAASRGFQVLNSQVILHTPTQSPISDPGGTPPLPCFPATRSPSSPTGGHWDFTRPVGGGLPQLRGTKLPPTAARAAGQCSAEPGGLGWPPWPGLWDRPQEGATRGGLPRVRS